MTKDWVDIWTEEEVTALSHWDKKLIECARKGKPLRSHIKEEKNRPILSARLIASLVTSQHNQNWNLHPKSLCIDGFRFTERLDFDQRHINNSLYFYNCSFEQQCQFIHGHYKTLFFDNCSFFKELNLIGSIISHGLYLSGSHLKNKNKISNCIFADGLTIHGHAFLRNNFKSNGCIRLLNAKIEGNLDLDGAIISSGPNVDDITSLFADGLTIGGAIFLRNGFKASGIIRLPGATLSSNLEIDNAEISYNLNDDNKNCIEADNISIDGSLFLRNNLSCKGHIHITNGTIKGDLEIWDAQINGDLNLRNTRTNQRLVFKSVTCDSTSRISLNHAFSDVLQDDLKSWQGFKEIHLDGFEYNHLHRRASGRQQITWLQKMPEEKYFPQPYEQLAKVLKTDGHLRDARNVLVEKQKQLFKHGNVTWLHRVWLFFTRYLIAFGYRPWNVIPYILLIFILGENIFLQAHKNNYIVPANPKVSMEMAKGKKTLEEIMPTYPTFIPLIYSVDSFLPFVELDQEKYWMPDGKNTSGWGLATRIYRWFHIAMGWFLSTLLVAGLAGLVKKDD
ncbi:hypothetical protein RYZ26_09530 [Terasakiella sp. A23]|uniref:hypothetical protein n=1 Tax=Terasakiella sp. FCG-A23 TaxID=3080561 RepID=UPI002953F144|nr:hypothetical protein [Terasakiella sp. A23]MDV7339833.1 hypothetical protein [Terasakiella sp. A23]